MSGQPMATKEAAEAAFAEAKRWGVQPSLLLDPRPAPVQILHLQTELFKRMEAMETAQKACEQRTTALQLGTQHSILL
jgi:hypothetical protein